MIIMTKHLSATCGKQALSGLGKSSLCELIRKMIKLKPALSGLKCDAQNSQINIALGIVVNRVNLPLVFSAL